MATIVNGKEVADVILREVSEAIKGNPAPKLAAIIVGDDPASYIYVTRKRKVCDQVGIHSELHQFPADVSQATLISFLGKLDADGILVQVPLPPHLHKNSILNAIPPEKDVDCFNEVNVGRLAQGSAILKPCTPAGIIEMLKYYKIPTKGQQVTIINRSPVVGQPLSLMLAQEPYNSTVTVCHEHTLNLEQHTPCADIIITAVGKYPKFQLYPQWVKPGAVVIDVAMNRVNGKLFGDVVEFEKMKEVAGFISPVPGGVGPCTVAMLMKNVVLAKRNHDRK